ncbi:MAG: HTH domain-containing protein [Myxococcota bacterium]
MRASRLLHMLLLLQNRGRQTTAQLAAELEVCRRTILRDLEALEEAGLPVITHRGSRGGVELAFQYRTRLTGLDPMEAEAIALVLGRPLDALRPLGLERAAARACSKVLESLPDSVRRHAERGRRQFRIEADGGGEPDERITAMAEAVRGRNVVRLAATSIKPRRIHPIALRFDGSWWVTDGRSGEAVPLAEWGNINISARRFQPAA